MTSGERNEHIALAAAVQWELAKGYLNAVVGALGQMSSISRDEDNKFKYQLMDEAITRFVKEVEESELYLP
jgi:hypothetical protein